MPKVLYVGCDPGASGGIAVIDSGMGVEYHYVMPKSAYRLTMLARILRGVYPAEQFKIAIENVHAMPGQGVTSMFSFGKQFGRLEAAMEIIAHPVLVSPRKWQAKLGIPAKKKLETKAQHKEKLRLKAIELFPDLELWNRSRSLGIQRSICDALLIAEYVRRLHV